MGLVSNENYINIQGWMINELKLSGNSLLVYAIIYSFSQDGESAFKGSLQYLADWCNATKQGIQKNLKELLDRGLITKQEHIINNQKFCEYSCIPYNKVAYPIQQSCINNKEHNTSSKGISNNKLLDITRGDIVGNNAKKKNLYQKCTDEIMQYTNNVVLQEKLMQYLNLRLEIARSDGKVFYQNMWKGLLNDLDQLTSDTNTAIQIVEQSIKKGWRGFFELKDYSKSKVKNDPTERNVDPDKKSDYELDLVDKEY